MPPEHRALPRGPHRLSRADVVDSQRTRILAALTEAVSDKGYADLVVADVLARSGVSRATFYELFTGKADCFEAAYDLHASAMVDLLQLGVEQLRRAPDVAPIDKLARVLDIYLAALQANPAVARTFLVEVYAAGSSLIERRRQVIEVFVDLVAATHDGEDGPLGTRPDQRFAAEFIVAAVSSFATNTVAVGDLDRLPALRDQLIALARQLIGEGRRSKEPS